ncbi:MAG: dihydroorotase [Thermoleophilia bacterium]
MNATIAKRGTKATLLIRDARAFDPALGLDQRADIAIEKGQIIAITPTGKGKAPGGDTIEAGGRLLLPGFVDLHTHLRTPGREDEEDIASGTAAAAAGGYVTICAMPNTDPVVDNAAVLQSLIEAAESEAVVRVAFLGAISRGQQGAHLADMWDMAEAGAVAFSDDGRPVTDAGLLRAAFQAASLTGLPLSLHCEDPDLAANGVMNDSRVSARLGLTGMPDAAESAAIARDLQIAAYEEARVHIAHISCAASLDHLRAARGTTARDPAGQSIQNRVTGEVTPHHLALTDAHVESLDSNFKMNPPLRGEADRLALVAALADGTIDCIATDHAPHAAQEKETPFEEAAFGVIGLETAFPVLYTTLVETGDLPLDRLVLAMSTGPARAFNLPVPAIAEGEEANLCLVDTEAEYVIAADSFKSKSRNSAFNGRRVKGRVQLTLAAGRIAYKREESSV